MRKGTIFSSINCKLGCIFERQRKQLHLYKRSSLLWKSLPSDLLMITVLWHIPWFHDLNTKRNSERTEMWLTLTIYVVQIVCFSLSLCLCIVYVVGSATATPLPTPSFGFISLTVTKRGPQTRRHCMYRTGTEHMQTCAYATNST